jgi:H+-translocating diphosphatase
MDITLNIHIITYVCSVIGLLFAGLCAYKVLHIEPKPIEPTEFRQGLTEEQVTEMQEIAKMIEDGANTFLLREYLFMLIFIVVLAILIIFLAEHKLGYFYTVVAFIIGTQASLGCGYIGMIIATKANIRTTYRAW